MRIPDWLRDIRDPAVSEKNFIPIYKPVFSGNEKRYLEACIDQQWISAKGPFVGQFEEAFAGYCGTPYAVACSSGTAALELSLRALGIGRGDEVIVPVLTMASSAFAVTYTGAKPVFAESDPDTGSLDPSAIETVITGRTRAILAVHLYGNPADLDALSQIARRHNLHLIQDAAEAIGSTYHGKQPATYTDLCAYSLYANKIITSGQGGILTTRSKELYTKIKRLNNYAFSKRRHFWHTAVGFTYKLSNLQAAVALAQMERIQSLVGEKQRVSQTYAEFLSPCLHHIAPLPVTAGAGSNYWMVAYRLSSNNQAIGLRRHLATHGIETRSFFIPLHLQIPYRRQGQGDFPIACALAQSGILFPSGPGLSKSTIERVTTYIREYFAA